MYDHAANLGVKASGPLSVRSLGLIAAAERYARRGLCMELLLSFCWFMLTNNACSLAVSPLGNRGSVLATKLLTSVRLGKTARLCDKPLSYGRCFCVRNQSGQYIVKPGCEL